MPNPKPIQVFEHDRLMIGEQGFTESQWDALGFYNQKCDSRFLTLLPKGVKFSEYVGVIQIGRQTIEILPKIDRQETDKIKWQQVLINMLHACHWMEQFALQTAPLRIKHNSILEAYLELFISQCERLLRIGLIKKYKDEETNKLVLKGKLLFGQHLQKNIVHQERFYTRSTEYNKDNIFNQIIYKAIHLLSILSGTIHLKDRINRLLLNFPELSDIRVTRETFANLKYDRKTLHYKEAIEIAAMLLLNYRPDIRGGKNHILAILFDMNDLWEEYVFRQLKKSNISGLEIRFQSQKRFWELDNTNSFKLIRPDIVIGMKKNKMDENVIIDTKWKLPDYNIPSDQDLKQMFIYNEYWTGKVALLLYPNNVYTESPLYISGKFAEKPDNQETHRCGLLKISVLNQTNNALDITFGGRIINFLEKEIFA
jgi:5-methylcytosine-specific restriction enzyme subunit McrC